MISVASILLLFTSTLPLPAHIPDDLHTHLLPTDFIVIGRLHDVQVRELVEYSSHSGRKSTAESGIAWLTVEEVLWGDVEFGAELQVKWVYSDSLPDDMKANPHREGESGIYFLVCPMHLQDNSKFYRCSASARETITVGEHLFFPLDTRKEIERIIRGAPIRITGLKPAYGLADAIDISLHFFNATPEPLWLPALRVEGDRLLHSSGFQIVLWKDKDAGGPRVAPRDNAMESVEMERVILEPRETLTIDLDLRNLFEIEQVGSYSLQVGLDSWAEQLNGAFMILGDREEDHGLN